MGATLTAARSRQPSCPRPKRVTEEEEEEEAEAEDEESSLEVVCPDGCEVGDVIVIATEDGMEMEIAIPEGVAPGDAFNVTIA